MSFDRMGVPDGIGVLEMECVRVGLSLDEGARSIPNAGGGDFTRLSTHKQKGKIVLPIENNFKVPQAPYIENDQKSQVDG